MREGRAEAARLEERLSDLVNAAYGFTPSEVYLLWSTAPPRMPGFNPAVPQHPGGRHDR